GAAPSRAGIRRASRVVLMTDLQVQVSRCSAWQVKPRAGVLIQSPSMWISGLALTILCAGAMAGAALDQKDVEFGRPGGKALLLDLHVPDGPGPFPAAILVHGGGFDAGSRGTNVRPLFDVLANAGFAWFSVDYRMAPEFRFPEAKADIDSAIRWVKANAKRYHVDATKIALIGE